MRRTQLSFGDGLIAEEVSDLREDWMKHADEVLTDEEIVAIVYEALAKRHPKSRCRGQRGTPADAVLRLLILKHVRNWSYELDFGQKLNGFIRRAGCGISGRSRRCRERSRA